MLAGRRLRILTSVAATAVLTLLSLAWSLPADAHARLVSSSPAANATVTSWPTQVTLTFDEPPLSQGAVLAVTDGNGRVWSTGAVRLNGSTLATSLVAGGGSGSYTIRYRVVSDDGHPVSDALHFKLAGAAPTGSPSVTSPPTASPDATSPGSTLVTTTMTKESNGRAQTMVVAAAIAVVVLAVALTALVGASRGKRS